jgi:hypothetical protein
MNRPQRCNNPGNLRFAHQKESTGPDPDGYAVFPSAPAGWRALISQIVLDKSRGLNLGDWMLKYAPSNENDTVAYTAFVTGNMRATIETPLQGLSAYALAGVIAQYEGWNAE